jgi:hypothetical protein
MNKMLANHYLYRIAQHSKPNMAGWYPKSLYRPVISVGNRVAVCEQVSYEQKVRLLVKGSSSA